MVKHPAPRHAHAMLLPCTLCLAMKSLTFSVSSWCFQVLNVVCFHLPNAGSPLLAVNYFGFTEIL